MGIKKLDQLGEVGERSGQPVDLVDDDDIDLACPDVGQELLQGRAFGRSAGETAIVIAGLDEGPAGMRLTADIGLRGIILGLQRVELLLQPGIGRHPCIDGAADRAPWSGIAHRRAAPADPNQ